MKRQLASGIILFFSLFNPACAETQISYKETRIPVADAGSSGLETLLVWPNDSAPDPLTLKGSSR
jgi:hypothetical protein